MSVSVCILRKASDGSQLRITFDEWKAYIASDPDFVYPAPNYLNYDGERLVLLRSNSVEPDNWEWLHWRIAGEISSDWFSDLLLHKMERMARHFGAVMTTEEGYTWTVDEDGNHVEVPEPVLSVETSRLPKVNNAHIPRFVIGFQQLPESVVIIWHLLMEYLAAHQALPDVVEWQSRRRHSVGRVTDFTIELPNDDLERLIDDRKLTEFTTYSETESRLAC